MFQCLRTYIDSSLSRNIGTKDHAVGYCHIKSCFYTDTLFVTGTTKSSRGNICAQLFVSDKGYVAIYFMQHQRDCILALMQFAKDFSAPDVLICDHTLHKNKERSRSSEHKLVQHSKSLKLRLSGLIGLSFTLALLRRLQEQICGPLVCS